MLHEGGWTVTAAGTFSEVWLKGGRAMKIRHRAQNDYDAAGVAYAELAMAHPAITVFPRIYSIDADGTNYSIELERLQPLGRLKYEDRQRMQNARCRLNQFLDNPSYLHVLDLPGEHRSWAVIMAGWFSSHSFHRDMHDDNIMARQAGDSWELVATDPVSPWRSPGWSSLIA